jgi:hypothetical protein
MKVGTFGILLMILIIFLIGCKKKTTDSGNDCLSKLDFTKITFTNDIGQTLSPDPTDWRNDSTWCDIEYGLFSTHNINLTGSDTSKLFTILFPNPLRDLGMFVLIRPKLCPFQCVIVNRSFQVLDTFSIPNLSGTCIKNLSFTDSLKYKHGEYYRIYYAAHCTKQLFFFKGHGDFKLE